VSGDSWSKFRDELKGMVALSADAVKTHYSEETRPRLQELLNDAAIVAARRVAGDDTRLAEAALESSFASVALREQLMIQRQGADLALRAALKIAGILGSAL